MFILKKLTTAMVAAALFIFSTISVADDAAEVEKIRAELAKIMSPIEQAEIAASPVKGVYQVAIENQYSYAFVDGDYVLLGDLLNTKTRQNLGDIAAKKKMAETIDAVSLDKMIVYGPKDAKRHITVFTDIDCGYCRKLHNEVPELVKADIQVRYLAFPRAGIGSKSYDKYVSVWCNDDPNSALTTAKNGGNVAQAKCDNPVSEVYELGKKVGIKGTPTIIMDNGNVVPGYVPHARLIKSMGINS